VVLNDQPTSGDRRAGDESSATLDATLAYGPGHSTLPRPGIPPAGSPLIDGYAITGEIARGGMGAVYAAIDVALEREVAIKTLLPSAYAGRFVIESKITAKLPQVIPDRWTASFDRAKRA
jgi:serine/threonine protein kinase